MTTHIALLRGINVGGHKKVLMADLRELISKLGFTDVKTYIQTGNILFNTKSQEENPKLAKHIADAILSNYGFEVPVLVRTMHEFETIVEQNPYWNNPQYDKDRLHFTLLDKIPQDEHLTPLKALNILPECFEITNTNVYLYCTKPYQDTKLGNNIFEKKLKVKATTRNWKTIMKIWELSQS